MSAMSPKRSATRANSAKATATKNIVALRSSAATPPVRLQIAAPHAVTASLPASRFFAWTRGNEYEIPKKREIANSAAVADPMKNEIAIEETTHTKKTTFASLFSTKPEAIGREGEF